MYLGTGRPPNSERYTDEGPLAMEHRRSGGDWRWTQRAKLPWKLSLFESQAFPFINRLYSCCPFFGFRHFTNMVVNLCTSEANVRNMIMRLRKIHRMYFCVISGIFFLAFFSDAQIRSPCPLLHASTADFFVIVLSRNEVVFSEMHRARRPVPAGTMSPVICFWLIHVLRVATLIKLLFSSMNLSLKCLL